ncbi:hypothetical protein B5817_05255 [Mycobacterium tuberculosis]|nr:hypothetical protein B5817_05255 [Mycobacterium tuberculosis]AWY80126.1 hypothetical protein B0W96_04650 [Mycobacterium tuberculosis]
MKRTSRSLTAALLGIAALLAGCIKPNTFDPYANPGRGELDRRQKIVNGRPDLETVQQQLANLDATIRAMIAKYSPQTRFSTGVTVSHLTNGCNDPFTRTIGRQEASELFFGRPAPTPQQWLQIVTELAEPPRHVRRLQFLERMGSCQVVHRGGTRRSCVSGRCGWSQRSAVSTIRSGQRSVRSPVYLVLAARRRCVSGCARRRSMPAHGPGPRPKNPLS